MSNPWRRRLTFAAMALGVITLAACGRAAENDAAAGQSSPDTAVAPNATGAANDTGPDADAAGSARDSGPGTASTPAGRTGSSAAASTGRDSARGTVRRVGSQPNDALVLEQASGTMLALDGRGAELLRAVEGLEVVVAGRLTTERLTPGSPRPIRGFEVDRFTVRALDGRVAHDGVLVSRDGAWFLRMAEGGEQRIESPPAALREHVGARVWIAGPLDGPPQTFGVIHR